MDVNELGKFFSPFLIITTTVPKILKVGIEAELNSFSAMP
jgi:hypothetical protein